MRLLLNFSLFCALISLSFGAVIEFNELKDKPKGLVKDYYINRLLTERKLTKKQIEILSEDIYHKGGLAQKNIEKIVPPKPYIGRCPGYGVKNILDANLTCKVALSTLKFNLKLSPKVRKKLALDLNKTHPQKALALLSLNSPDPTKAFIKNLLAGEFLALLELSDEAKKAKLLNMDLPAKFMDKLYSQKGFNKLLNNLVMGRKFSKFRQNFLKISPKITSDNNAFLLAINAITFDKEALAAQFFARAAVTFERKWQRDNAVFWLYLLSGDDKILARLAKSDNINIYSIYAKDLINLKALNNKNISQVTAFKVNVPNPSKKNLKGFDESDPFLWQNLAALAKDINASEAKKMAQKFYTKQSLGAYAFFMQKATNWETHYFLMPKSPALDDLNATRKALIYSLARQESLFLPSVVSTSYALGTMQFMPFLANHIGKKELKIPNFDQDELFKPDVAFRFANHHLDYLEKYLYHPLFIAYAYNGGIGFTRRLITRKDMFKKGKFEPFLSMELVPAAETRDYGKKVLANYVIYSMLSGSNIEISQLFEILTKPALTDKFRKQE